VHCGGWVISRVAVLPHRVGSTAIWAQSSSESDDVKEGGNEGGKRGPSNGVGPAQGVQNGRCLSGDV
jgi:hypothetical protein